MLLLVSLHIFNIVAVLLSFKTDTSTDSNSGSESTIPAITGSVGGAAFFLVIFLLCGVMLGVRRSYKIRSLSLDNKMVIELNSDVKMDDNPSYNIVTQNQGKQDDQYDYVLHNTFSIQDNTKDTIKMDSNPSYGRVQGCYIVADDVTEPDYDVTIQTNPSYNSILKEQTIKMSEDEDQHGYVETNSYSIATWSSRLS